MSILDILSAPWAIMPGHLEQIRDIYASHLRGEGVNLQELEARRGAPLPGPVQGYEVRDGVALIPVRGVMAQRMNLMAEVSGGTSSELLARDVKAATEDTKIKGIILRADTPGGAVAGTQLAAQAVMAARGVKPVVTLVEGLMASAGVWVGTGASQVYLSSAVDQVGSIGVVIEHIDRSKQLDAVGIKKTEVFAGKYKRIASENGPLTESGKATLQDTVDTIYSIFVGDVANQRGVSVEKVLSDMADGRMFIGQQAIDAGLADGFNTLDELIGEVRDQAKWRPIPSGGSRAKMSLPVVATGPPAAARLSPLQSPMSSLPEQVAQWATDNPDGASALRAQGAADERARLTPDHETALAKARQEGAAAERDRIAGVRAAGLPGHDALIERLAADGKTTPGEAALAVNAAERELRAAAVTARGAEVPAPVAFAAAGDEGLERKPEAPAAPDATAVHEQAQRIASRIRTLRAEAATEGRVLNDAAALHQAQSELTGVS